MQKDCGNHLYRKGSSIKDDGAMRSAISSRGRTAKGTAKNQSHNDVYKKHLYDNLRRVVSMEERDGIAPKMWVANVGNRHDFFSCRPLPASPFCFRRFNEPPDSRH